LLFNRHKSEIVLTQNGKELFNKLTKVINILESDKFTEKEINIGCIRFVADNYLDEAIVKFKNKNKKIKLSLNILYNTDLYQKLKKDELDLIICRYPLFYKFDQDFKLEKIFDAENVFVCSKEYYAKERKKMDKSDYIYSLILPGSSEKRRNVEQCLINNNIKYNVNLEIPNSNLLKKLIEKGMGIGYINKKFIEKELLSDELIIIEKFKNLPIDNISIIYNSKKINNITKEFINIIKLTIGKSNT